MKGGVVLTEGRWYTGTGSISLIARRTGHRIPWGRVNIKGVGHRSKDGRVVGGGVEVQKYIDQF
eukprot:118571-Hanusia_phi.AAC.2